MSATSDKEILELFQNPKTRSKAFKMLVEKYQTQMYWAIRRILHVHEDTHDVLQETFIRVWNHLDTFRGESGLYAWLYRIAINQAFTYLRKQKQRPGADSDHQVSEMADMLAQDPWFDGEKAQIKLMEAIQQLSERQQVIFNFRYFHEYPYEKIGEILEVSAETARTSYFFAVKKIKKYLSID